jgi:hypothetical protein
MFYVRRIPSPAHLPTTRFPPSSAMSSRESLPELRKGLRNRDQQQPPPLHTDFKPPSVLVPGSPYNIQDIPEWLQVYSQAPTEMDCKMRWELFRLDELDCFDAMLKRLFRHELERVVMSYEVLR